MLRYSGRRDDVSRKLRTKRPSPTAQNSATQPAELCFPLGRRPLVRNGNVIEVAQLPYRAGIARRY
jgi:hypothetical protein